MCSGCGVIDILPCGQDYQQSCQGIQSIMPLPGAPQAANKHMHLQVYGVFLANSGHITSYMIEAGLPSIQNACSAGVDLAQRQAGKTVSVAL